MGSHNAYATQRFGKQTAYGETDQQSETNKQKKLTNEKSD
jgi:hypothetical protein